MKLAILLFFAFLMLVMPSGFCEAAVPAGSNATQSSNYWIHLDSVSDKHVNDTFVITGTTNIPAGDLINISTDLSAFPHCTKHDVSVYWSREYKVSVLEGPGGQNTFTTPPVQITPSKVDEGNYEVIRENDEYIIVAKFESNNTTAEDSQLYQILAPETSTVTFPLSNSKPSSTDIPLANSQKSPLSPVLAIISLGIIGLYKGAELIRK